MRNNATFITAMGAFVMVNLPLEPSWTPSSIGYALRFGKDGVEFRRHGAKGRFKKLCKDGVDMDIMYNLNEHQDGIPEQIISPIIGDNGEEIWTQFELISLGAYTNAEKVAVNAEQSLRSLVSVLLQDHGFDWKHVCIFKRKDY